MECTLVQVSRTQDKRGVHCSLSSYLPFLSHCSASCASFTMTRTPTTNDTARKVAHKSTSRQMMAQAPASARRGRSPPPARQPDHAMRLIKATARVIRRRGGGRGWRNVDAECNALANMGRNSSSSARSTTLATVRLTPKMIEACDARTQLLSAAPSTTERAAADSGCG